jgi:hypothetical protein
MSWAGSLNDFKDGVTFTGAANNDTTPAFTLLGGGYLLETHSTGTASAILQIKDPDGNFVSFSATTPAVLDLPPGTYQIVMGASAGTAGGSLIRVPYRAA